MQLTIFISYSQEDYKTEAKFVRDYVSKHTPYSIVFIDQLIPKGKKWQAEIDNTLKVCHIFIVILTNGAIRSIPVKNEVKTAKENEERSIIPCKDQYLTLDWKNIPWELGTYQGLIFNSKEELGRMLVKEIQDIRKSNEKFKEIDYNAYLDESYGDVSVGRLTFPTSEALRELDPTVYYEEMLDWSIDTIYQELTEGADNER